MKSVSPSPDGWPGFEYAAFSAHGQVGRRSGLPLLRVPPVSWRAASDFRFLRQKAKVAKMQKDEYYNSPYYQDKQPFAYNAPAIDDWYDSGYEESLYSPFSFDN